MQQVNWINYQYQLLRYRHDHLTGEFANLGIIYFDADTQTLNWRFEDRKYGRLSKFFGESVQGNYILSALKQMNKRLRELQKEGTKRYAHIEVLTKELPQNKLNIQDKNVEIKVVSEQEAEQVALELKAALDAEHN